MGEKIKRAYIERVRENFVCALKQFMYSINDTIFISENQAFVIKIHYSFFIVRLLKKFLSEKEQQQYQQLIKIVRSILGKDLEFGNTIVSF